MVERLILDTSTLPYSIDELLPLHHGNGHNVDGVEGATGDNSGNTRLPLHPHSLQIHFMCFVLLYRLLANSLQGLYIYQDASEEPKKDGKRPTRGEVGATMRPGSWTMCWVLLFPSWCSMLISFLKNLMCFLKNDVPKRLSMFHVRKVSETKNTQKWGFMFCRVKTKIK
jgi:hypothetical protein